MILGIWYKSCDYTGRKIRVDVSKEGLRPKGELLALSRPVPPGRIFVSCRSSAPTSRFYFLLPMRIKG